MLTSHQLVAYGVHTLFWGCPFAHSQLYAVKADTLPVLFCDGDAHNLNESSGTLGLWRIKARALHSLHVSYSRIRRKVQTHWHATTDVRKGEPVLCYWYLGSDGLTLKSRELYVQVTDGIKAKLQHNWDVNAHTGDQRQGWTGIPATELHPQPSRPLLMGHWHSRSLNAIVNKTHGLIITSSSLPKLPKPLP